VGMAAGQNIHQCQLLIRRPQHSPPGASVKTLRDVQSWSERPGPTPPRIVPVRGGIPTGVFCRRLGSPVASGLRRQRPLSMPSGGWTRCSVAHPEIERGGRTCACPDRADGRSAHPDGTGHTNPAAGAGFMREEVERSRVPWFCEGVVT
jgi:hypothetical protein